MTGDRFHKLALARLPRGQLRSCVAKHGPRLALVDFEGTLLDAARVGLRAIEVLRLAQFLLFTVDIDLRKI